MPNTISFENDMELLLGYLKQLPADQYLNSSELMKNQKDQETVGLGLRRILVPAILTTLVDPSDEEERKNNDMPASHTLAFIDDTQDLFSKATFAHMLELNAPSVMVKGDKPGGKRDPDAIPVTEKYEISTPAENIKALKELHGHLSGAQNNAKTLSVLEKKEDSEPIQILAKTQYVINELYNAHEKIQFILNAISSNQAPNIPNQKIDIQTLQRLDNSIGRKLALMQKKHQQLLAANPPEVFLGVDNTQEDIHKEFIQSHPAFNGNIQALQSNTNQLLESLYQTRDELYEQIYSPIDNLKSSIEKLEKELKDDFELKKNSDKEITAVNIKINKLQQEIDDIEKEREQSTINASSTNLQDKTPTEQERLKGKKDGDEIIFKRKMDEKNKLIQEKNVLINNLRKNFRAEEENKKKYEKLEQLVNELNSLRKPISFTNSDYAKLVAIENLIGTVQKVQLKLFEFYDPIKMVSLENRIIVEDKIKELVSSIQAIKKSPGLNSPTADYSGLLEPVMHYFNNALKFLNNPNILTSHNEEKKASLSEIDRESDIMVEEDRKESEIVVEKDSKESKIVSQEDSKESEIVLQEDSKPNLSGNEKKKYSINNTNIINQSLKTAIEQLNAGQLKSKNFYLILRNIQEEHKKTDPGWLSWFAFKAFNIKTDYARYEQEANAIQQVKTIFIDQYTKSKEFKAINEQIHKLQNKISGNLDSVQDILRELAKNENKKILKNHPALIEKKKEIEEIKDYYSTNPKFVSRNEKAAPTDNLKETKVNDKLTRTMAQAALESSFIAKDAEDLAAKVTKPCGLTK